MNKHLKLMIGYVVLLTVLFQITDTMDQPTAQPLEQVVHSITPIALPMIPVTVSVPIQVEAINTPHLIDEVCEVAYRSKQYQVTKKHFYKFTVATVNRKEDYGQVSDRKLPLNYHSGGEELDYVATRKLVKYVMGRMPVIKSNNGLVDLVMETFITESRLGGVNYIPSYKRGDIGLGQFREDSAISLLDWLKNKHVVNPELRDAVMSFYDRKLSLKDNLFKNVQFSIAMTIVEYWRKVPNLNHLDLSKIGSRGVLWKSAYNTRYGAGTIEAYVERVTQYHARRGSVAVK